MRALLVAVAYATLLAMAVGCQSLVALQRCGQIPADGCPIGRGGSCDDTACGALYDCTEGAWVEVRTCSANGSGGAGGSGGGDADAGADGACEDPVTIDHAGEKAGCKPDLQSPDCPAVAAEPCAAEACLTDCMDFFLCTDNGWAAVAYCTEEGQIVVTQ